jgi:hypothetical protein
MIRALSSARDAWRSPASAAATAPLALSRRPDPLELEAVEASTERALVQNIGGTGATVVSHVLRRVA